jgi:hypothetical protein
MARLRVLLFRIVVSVERLRQHRHYRHPIVGDSPQSKELTLLATCREFDESKWGRKTHCACPKVPARPESWQRKRRNRQMARQPIHKLSRKSAAVSHLSACFKFNKNTSCSTDSKMELRLLSPKSKTSRIVAMNTSLCLRLNQIHIASVCTLSFDDASVNADSFPCSFSPHLDDMVR